MKNHQDNTDALPALLRTADSVDTPETNSLCCAAAGIIASSSSTTEALTLHEKLREATTPDATLNAQKRSLAQPAAGYKRHTGIIVETGRRGRKHSSQIQIMALDDLRVPRTTKTLVDANKVQVDSDLIGVAA